jgi:hypothetical protein
MDKRWFILIAIAVLGALWSVKSTLYGVVHYRGETIKLSKPYFDYDQYKNDTNNIDPSETTRVQTLVTTAPIKRSFTSRNDVFAATAKIGFPGYGSGVIPGPKVDGHELFAVLIEVPRANKDRFIVFRGREGGYEVIADLVHDEALPYSIREEEGSCVFFDSAGQELFRQPVIPPSEAKSR